MSAPDELLPVTLRDVEKQIEHHERAIRDLCEAAVRLDEVAAMPGAVVKRWLVRRGYSPAEAVKLIVKVVGDRRAARGQS